MAFDRRHGLLAIPMHHAQFSLHRISINGLNSLSSVFCQPSSDNLFQAALALASRSWLSPPESIFLPAEGRPPRKRATLSSNGGCVENKLIMLFPDNGFTINIWAVDGLAFMGSLFE
jgi:hypothetical protein